MRRKMIRKIAPFLCSIMILVVPCISAGASQPSPPPSQGTVANGVEADEISQSPADPDATTAEESAAGADSESETQSRSETESEETETEEMESETEEESLANTEDKAPEPKEEETIRDEKAAESDDSITLIETESAIDAEGNVTMTVNTAEALVLPVTITMKGSEGAFSMTVSRSGQEIKIKPDTYDITKAVDGNGKKLPSGAELTIPKEGGIIYLDFNKPDDGENTTIDFLRTNCWFLVIAVFLVFLYRKYFHR